MALQNSFVIGNFCMDLGGKFAGHLASCEIGSLKAESIDMPAAADYITKKGIGNLEYGDCTVVVGASQVAQQIEWISSIWNKNIIEQSGAIILGDHNFKERRRAEFTNALITECKFDDFDANGGGKKPYQLTYKFAPEALKYVSGTGAQIKADLTNKQKAFSATNFRSKLGALPCERVTKISGISVTSEVAKEYHGQFRTPLRHQANVKFGDVTFEVSGDEKTFNEWNKWATLTLQDGVCTEAEELTCTIELLDQSLKNTLGTITLMGVGLKEFKFGPKMEHNKSGMATLTAICNVEDMRFELTQQG